MNAEHKATCREVLAIGIRQCENLIRGNNDPYYEALLVRYKAALAALDTEAAPPVADDVLEAISSLRAFVVVYVAMHNSIVENGNDPYSDYAKIVQTWLDAQRRP